MSKMKKKKYNTKEENPSKLELTWRTYNPWYDIEIQKRISKEGPSKKTQVH
jgi:hypothetical protein